MYLRCTTRIYGITSEQPLRVVCMQFLNMVTGAHPRSEDLWNEEVLVQIEARFGIRALSSLEKLNISRYAFVASIFPRELGLKQFSAYVI